MSRNDHRPVDAPDPDLDACIEAGTDCVSFGLRKASRSVSQIYDAALEPAGLKGTQFSLLAALHLSGPVAITHLARTLVMDRTTVTRNLKPLERRGLIAILPGADQRTRQAALTPLGRELLARALPLWRAAQARTLERIGVERWQRLSLDLGAVVVGMRP